MQRLTTGSSLQVRPLVSETQKEQMGDQKQTHSHVQITKHKLSKRTFDIKKISSHQDINPVSACGEKLSGSLSQTRNTAAVNHWSQKDLPRDQARRSTGFNVYDGRAWLQLN